MKRVVRTVVTQVVNRPVFLLTPVAVVAAVALVVAASAQTAATQDKSQTRVQAKTRVQVKDGVQAKAKVTAKVTARVKPAKIFKAADGNLLPNGDFENGEVTPKHWQTIDGLSTFWVKDRDLRRGRVLRFDSDVLQSQAYDWWLKIDDGASPLKAPQKIPTTPPKYDTLAGLDGVWFWSDPIRIKKGQQYWLTLDVKGPGILLWLVGYPQKPKTSFGADAGAVQQYFSKRRGTAPPNKRNRKAFIHKYKWKGQLKAGGSNSWKTYSRRKKPFHPTKYTPSVRWVRVLLFPFWPPGEYYIDNVKLVEYDPKIHGQK